MKSECYPAYPLQISDSGYFFKRNSTYSPQYIQLGEKVVFANNGWEAKSILVLGNGALHVVLWINMDGMRALWFLNEKLNFITNKNLLTDPSFSNTDIAKLWLSYLKDIANRIWYALTTPNLLREHPDFTPLETFISPDVHGPIKQVFNSFTQGCEFVNFAKLADSAAKLQNYYPSIQKNYLKQGMEWLSTCTDRWIDFFVNDSVSLSPDSDNWQDRAIMEGSVEIFCPFSGKSIRSNESLLFYYDGFITAYRFHSEGEVFFLLTGKHYNEKMGIYFPRRNIYFYWNTLDIDQYGLNNFFLDIVVSWQQIKPYLLSDVERTAVGSARDYHIGHFLWNDLTAIERMQRREVMDKLAGYYVSQTESEHYGPIDTLFPELSGKVQRINLHELPCIVYESNHLYVKPSDQYIHQSLVDKIIRYSTNKLLIHNQLSEEMQNFQASDYGVVILFTIRMENRSWLDQEQGICHVMTRLSENYPGKIALVIDGQNTNSSGDKLKSHGEVLIKNQKGMDLFGEEKAMAERIKSAIASEKIAVIDTIGCTVSESINWSLLCDFFVVPWGAGLAKYKWVANKPGLIFSSKKVLQGKGDLHIYDSPKIREDALLCDYMDPAAIIDVHEDVSVLANVDPHSRGNFNLVIDELYRNISEMCEKYGRVKPSSYNDYSFPCEYVCYPLEHSKVGYFFRKNQANEPNYIFHQNGKHIRFKNDGWTAKSILILGNDELHVVLWKNKNDCNGTWFLDENLRYFSNQNLLSDANYKNSPHSKLWSSYLSDVLHRVWNSLIIPDLIRTYPDYSPSELYISPDIMEDVNTLFSSVNRPCQFIDLSQDQSDVLHKIHPRIQKSYLIDNLLSSSYADNWQDKALINGYIEIKNPFTGELIQSNESFIGHTTGYRFQFPDEVFFLLTSIPHSNIETAYFFPKQNVLIYRSNTSIGKDDITSFISSIFINWELIKPYLLRKGPKAAAITVLGSHIDHHLWNELSALERMDRNNALNNVAQCYVSSPQSEFFGPIDALFPRLSGKVQRMNPGELPKTVYRNHHLYVRPCDSFISRNLADRIINYASNEAAVGQDFYASFQKVTKDRFTAIILFTIRLDNRSWIDQEKGICEILIKLSENYDGNIAFIIDGHNTNRLGTRLKSHKEDLIKSRKGIDLFDEEYQMAERIKDAVSSNKINIVNTIGCSVQESIRWCLQCDFFVAPWGAGLAKYKWVTNTPGLVFTSRQMLTSGGDLHIYDSLQYREDAYSCEYLDIEAVEDIDDISMIGGHPSKNFNLSTDALYKKISAMCEKYGRVKQSAEMFSKN